MDNLKKNIISIIGVIICSSIIILLSKFKLSNKSFKFIKSLPFHLIYHIVSKTTFHPIYIIL